MKSDKIMPGVFLVIIGACILLANFGYLHFHPENFIRLWPIFLVIGGISLLLSHYRSPWTTILKGTVWIAGIALLLFGDFGGRYNFWPGHHISWSDNNDDDDDDGSNAKDVKMIGNGTFNEPYQANIKVARFNLKGGATSYDLSDTTGQLFSAYTKNNKTTRYNFSHSMDGDSVYVIDFKMKNHNGFNFNEDENQTVFKLNPNPEWEFDLNVGAAGLDFDLSKFKVRKLDLNGGVGGFKIKLGNPLASTDITVSTGISGVDIYIPQSAACDIETDSGLSGNDFDGFTKIGDNTYQTPGYNAAKNKMHIHISGGLSGFNVHRY
jgi:hypothetical protein